MPKALTLRVSQGRQRLRGEMEDGVDLVAFDQRAQQIEVSDVALHELHARLEPLAHQVRVAREHAVEQVDLRAALEQVRSQVRATKACPSSHETGTPTPGVSHVRLARRVVK